MVNIKGIIELASAPDSTTDEMVMRNAETSLHVSKVAETETNKPTLATAKFIAEAILDFANRVENDSPHCTDLPQNHAAAVTSYEEKIKALEKRIGELNEKVARYETESNRFLSVLKLTQSLLQRLAEHMVLQRKFQNNGKLEDATGTTSFAIGPDQKLAHRLYAQILEAINVDNSEDLLAPRLPENKTDVLGTSGEKVIEHQHTDVETSPMYNSKLKVHKLLENLVERPWLKDHKSA